MNEYFVRVLGADGNFKGLVAVGLSAEKVADQMHALTGSELVEVAPVNTRLGAFNDVDGMSFCY